MISLDLLSKLQIILDKPLEWELETNFFSIFICMDSSRTLPGRSSQPKPQPWASIVGSAIALLTLTVPPTVITYYSMNDPLAGLSESPPVTSQRDFLKNLSRQ